MTEVKIAIIPGNANNLTCNFGFGKVRAEYREFLPYKGCPQLIWGDDRTFAIFQSVNPFAYLKNYLHEKKQIQDPNYIETLNKFLYQHKPEILICHSMGCLYLANYLKINQLPKSIIKIVCIQGDACRKTVFNTTVPVISGFCFWDYTLWFSALINKYLPIGLFGSSTVLNYFMFLSPPNPHKTATNNHQTISKLIKN